MIAAKAGHTCIDIENLALLELVNSTRLSGFRLIVRLCHAFKESLSRDLGFVNRMGSQSLE